MITIKEEFLGSVKLKLAVRIGGWEALGVWLALKGYVAAGNTGGFIPSDVIGDLPGIPKNWQKGMKGLMGCGKLQADGVRGAGLVVGVAHGYMLHDYEDHGTAPEIEELRRQKARDQKRNRRAQIARELEERRAAEARELEELSRPRTESSLSAPDITDRSPDNEPDNQADGSLECPAVSPRAGTCAGPPAYGHAGDPSPAQPSPAPSGESADARAVRQADRFLGSFSEAHPEDRWSFERWQATFTKTGATFDHKRARCLAERRLLGMTRQDVEDVLTGARADAYVTGQKDGTRHDSIGFLFGDADRYEAFRDAGRAIRLGTAPAPAQRSGARTSPLQPSHGLTGAEGAEVVR